MRTQARLSFDACDGGLLAGRQQLPSLYREHRSSFSWNMKMSFLSGPAIFPATCAARRSPRWILSPGCAKGMGYTGANIMMSAFGPIYDNPFGTVGDLGLIPALGSGTSTLTGRWGNEVSDLLAGTGFLLQRAAWVRLGGSGLFVLGMAGHADRPASGRLERGSSKPSSQRYTTKASL